MVALFRSNEAGLRLSSFFVKASDLDLRSWHSIQNKTKKLHKLIKATSNSRKLIKAMKKEEAKATFES
jgi:hypothetical protein